jgi:DNA adenine methylase
MKIGGTACKWGGICNTLDEATTRLLGSTTNLVQIEHMDALRIIERYDSSDVLMYLDPPYVMSSRKGGKLYRHEMDDSMHSEMLQLIKKSRAKIVLSGYDSELYNTILLGWHKSKTMSQTTSAQMAEETIWMNYDPPFRQIDILE